MPILSHGVCTNKSACCMLLLLLLLLQYTAHHGPSTLHPPWYSRLTTDDHPRFLAHAAQTGLGSGQASALRFALCTVQCPNSPRARRAIKSRISPVLLTVLVPRHSPVLPQCPSLFSASPSAFHFLSDTTRLVWAVVGHRGKCRHTRDNAQTSTAVRKATHNVQVPVHTGLDHCCVSKEYTHNSLEQTAGLLSNPPNCKTLSPITTLVWPDTGGGLTPPVHAMPHQRPTSLPP